MKQSDEGFPRGMAHLTEPPSPTSLARWRISLGKTNEGGCKVTAKMRQTQRETSMACLEEACVCTHRLGPPMSNSFRPCSPFHRLLTISERMRAQMPVLFVELFFGVGGKQAAPPPVCRFMNNKSRERLKRVKGTSRRCKYEKVGT